MSQEAHWQQVYSAKGDEALSWFQRDPRVSLELFDAIHPRPRRVIDVGGGQSAFAAGMLSRGVEQVCVLDISSAAIARAKTRLGVDAVRVSWIVADVRHSVDALGLEDAGQFDLWHDRAVFHFLTDAADRARYVQVACAAVRPGGHMIIATFAPTGPDTCSGLPVCRYDAPSLEREFAPQFARVASATETHVTPWGKAQDFSYAVLQRSAIEHP